MNGRSGLLVAGLAAAVAVPYFMTAKTQSDHPSVGFQESMWCDTLDADDPLAMSAPVPPATAAGSAMFAQAGTFAAADGMVPPGSGGYAQQAVSNLRSADQSLAEVMRFDVTPQWVMNRWQRVSTQLRSGDLSGLRVTLISGLSTQDLAGSLTYYFDSQKQLQRIAFEGTTGDPRPLVTFVTRHYELESEPVFHGEVYVKRDRRRVYSALLVELAPVVRRNEPYRRYRVRMELSRPGSRMPLSEEFHELLEGDAVK